MEAAQFVFNVQKDMLTMILKVHAQNAHQDMARILKVNLITIHLIFIMQKMLAFNVSLGIIMINKEDTVSLVLSSPIHLLIEHSTLLFILCLYGFYNNRCLLSDVIIN